MPNFTQCYGCARFDFSSKPNDPTCSVFPQGIPDAIFSGRFDHRKTFPGDSGRLFKQDEELPLWEGPMPKATATTIFD